MQLKQIPRVHKPSLQQFERDYVEANHPVVVTGALDHWSALERWADLDYLRSKVGNKNIVTSRVEPMGTSYIREKTFARYLDEVEENKEEQREDFLADIRLEKDLPELSGDVGSSSYHSTREYALWMGRRTYTPMHFHAVHHAIAAQITGTKRFLLFSPADSKFLHPKPWYSPLYNFTCMDLSRGQPSDVYMAKFSQACGWETTLNAGESLFIPVQWWHVVYGGPEFNILASAFYSAKLRQFHFPYPGLLALGHQLIPRKVNAMIEAHLFKPKVD
jgi:lysine-specific demethylase 8